MGLGVLSGTNVSATVFEEFQEMDGKVKDELPMWSLEINKDGVTNTRLVLEGQWATCWRCQWNLGVNQEVNQFSSVQLLSRVWLFVTPIDDSKRRDSYVAQHLEGVTPGQLFPFVNVNASRP